MYKKHKIYTILYICKNIWSQKKRLWIIETIKFILISSKLRQRIRGFMFLKKNAHELPPNTLKIYAWWFLCKWSIFSNRTGCSFSLIIKGTRSSSKYPIVIRIQDFFVKSWNNLIKKKNSSSRILIFKISFKKFYKNNLSDSLTVLWEKNKH